MMQIPDLKDTDCVYFEACGHLDGEHKSGERTVTTALVRAGRKHAYLRLHRGGRPGHLHLDIALTSYFRHFDIKKPQVTSNPEKIAKEVEEYLSKELIVGVTGVYLAPLNKIPAGSGVVLAGSNAVTSTINNKVIEVSGARLTLRESDFLRFIDWRFDQKETVEVDLYAVCSADVSATYFADLFARLDESYAIYVLGRAGDGARTP